ncbi:hypothetical protein NZD88_04295 [Chryseobacterium antibioticum]|uniref:Uncharacterized protein n=1 Tax=Chryseobacterium pyrolae TaxID=2987481 RepID=A0ABT2IDV0_9FLAO|nr:hypothetical protein [Chryseobacterium pyrolae]MCT2406776.1 hypothetical protein [Chryseobacterium pyrolae]
MAVLFCSTIIYGQVGMNTASPKSTLDINAKNATGTSTNADGILIPRVDRQRALIMSSVEPSTLIYINDISTGTTTGQASNIDAIGFYYFEGSLAKWVKLSTSGIVADSTPDAFVDDSANTMVKLGTNSSGGSRVVGSDFVIKDSGNVGVGTNSPTEKLHVNGRVKIVDGSQGASKVLTSDANGVSTWASLPNTTANNGLTKIGNNLQLGGTLAKATDIATAGFNTTFSGTGNLGIGTSSPVSGSKVNIQGGPLNIGNITQYAGGLQVKNLDGSKPILLAYDTSNSEKFRIGAGGNVGIGTTAPTERLDVEGNARIRSIPTTSLGSRGIVVADSNGNLSKVSRDNFEARGILVGQNKTSGSQNVTLNNERQICNYSVTIPAGQKRLFFLSINAKSASPFSNPGFDGGWGTYRLYMNNTLIEASTSKFFGVQTTGSAANITDINSPASFSSFQVVDNSSGNSAITRNFRLTYTNQFTATNVANKSHKAFADLVTLVFQQ